MLNSEESIKTMKITGLSWLSVMLVVKERGASSLHGQAALRAAWNGERSETLWALHRKTSRGHIWNLPSFRNGGKLRWFCFGPL